MKIFRKLYLVEWRLAFAAGIFCLVLIFPHYSNAEKEEPVQETTVEKTGIVDSVHEDGLVINDSKLLLDSSIALYNQYKSRIDQSSFKEGDQVIVTSVENEQASKQRVLSVRLAKQGRGQERNNDPESERRKPSQVIKKINNVWTN